MSRKNSAAKRPATPPPAPAPTVDHPGDDLPPEVLAGGPRATTANERFVEWEEGKILRMLREEFGGTGQVTLHRKHPAGGMPSFAYIGSIAADGFGIQNVASMYGGGDFRARVRGADGRINKDFSFTIDHSIPPKNPMTPGVEKKDTGDRIDVASIVNAIIAAMPRPAPPPDQSGMFELMKVALARPEPKPDPAMGTALQVFAATMEKITGRLDRMDQRIAETAEKPRTLREQLEELQALDELRGERGGEKEKPESFWKEIGKGAAEAIGPLIKAHFAGGVAGTLPGVPALPAPGPSAAPPASSFPNQTPINVTPTAAPTETTTEDMNPFITTMIARFRSAAIAAARKDQDPFEWVESMFAMVPDSYHEKIYTTANGEDWFARIFGGDAEAPRFINFLNEMRSAILLRAFVAHCAKFAAANQPPEETGRIFLGWMAQAFDDTLLNVADDTAAWGATFADSKLDPTWLEALRKFLVDELAGDEPGAEVVEMPTAAAGVTVPGATAIAASQPAPTKAKRERK